MRFRASSAAAAVLYFGLALPYQAVRVAQKHLASPTGIISFADRLIALGGEWPGKALTLIEDRLWEEKEPRNSETYMRWLQEQYSQRGMVKEALAPDGQAYVIDSALDPTSGARDHPPPDADSGIVTRKLNDGRQFRIVKLFHDPASLDRRLATLGFRPAIERTPRYFIHGKIGR